MNFTHTKQQQHPRQPTTRVTKNEKSHEKNSVIEIIKLCFKAKKSIAVLKFTDLCFKV